MNQKIIIYTDGACSGNPGPGGWGAIVGVLSPERASVIELSERELSTTNNRMEMQAALSALIFVKQNLELTEQTTIHMYTDSVYVIKGITQWVFGWKKKGWKNAAGESVTNQDLWENLDQVAQVLQKKILNKISWEYVRGHVGTPGNERCDELAVAESKNESVYKFNGPAHEYRFDIAERPKVEPLPENNWSSNSKSASKEVWYITLKNGVVSRYKTWAECEPRVKGMPGVKFKKVSSQEEETEILKSWGVHS